MSDELAVAERLEGAAELCRDDQVALRARLKLGAETIRSLDLQLKLTETLRQKEIDARLRLLSVLNEFRRGEHV